MGEFTGFRIAKYDDVVIPSAPAPPEERTLGQLAWYWHMRLALEALADMSLPRLITIIIISPGQWPGYWHEGIDLPPGYPRAATVTTWEAFADVVRMQGATPRAMVDRWLASGRDMEGWVKASINQQLQFPMGERLMGPTDVRQLFNYYGLIIEDDILYFRTGVW